MLSAKLAAEKKAARDAELERLRQLQQDNKDVAGIRQMLNNMDDQQEEMMFGMDLKSGMEQSRQQDEFGNISTDFLKENLDQFRQAKDEFDVAKGFQQTEEGKGMSMEAVKQMIKDQGIEAIRSKLGTPVDPKLSAMKQEKQFDLGGPKNLKGGDLGGDAEELVNMDEALQEIKESTGKMAENNLVVIEPANIGT